MSLWTRAVVIDCETLGLRADVHSIWELAVIEPNGAEHSWILPVDPNELDYAQPKALEINRFRERYHNGEFAVPDLRGMLSQVQEITAEQALVGVVPSFDEERLRRLFMKFSLRPLWHYQPVDVEVMAVGALSERARWTVDPEVADQLRQACAWPFNSDRVALALGVDPADYDRHTSLGDCRWARAMLRALEPPGIDTTPETAGIDTTPG